MITKIHVTVDKPEIQEAVLYWLRNAKGVIRYDKSGESHFNRHMRILWWCAGCTKVFNLADWGCILCFGWLDDCICRELRDIRQ